MHPIWQKSYCLGSKNEGQNEQAKKQNRVEKILISVITVCKLLITY
jgi:hypothetical protein